MTVCEGTHLEVAMKKSMKYPRSKGGGGGGGNDGSGGGGESTGSGSDYSGSDD